MNTGKSVVTAMIAAALSAAGKTVSLITGNPQYQFRNATPSRSTRGRSGRYRGNAHRGYTPGIPGHSKIAKQFANGTATKRHA